MKSPDTHPAVTTIAATTTKTTTTRIATTTRTAIAKCLSYPLHWQ